MTGIDSMVIASVLLTHSFTYIVNNKNLLLYGEF